MFSSFLRICKTLQPHSCILNVRSLRYIVFCKEESPDVQNSEQKDKAQIFSHIFEEIVIQFSGGPLNGTDKTAIFIDTFKNSLFYSCKFRKNNICYLSYFLKLLFITYQCVCSELSFRKTFESSFLFMRFCESPTPLS